MIFFYIDKLEYLLEGGEQLNRIELWCFWMVQLFDRSLFVALSPNGHKS